MTKEEMVALAQGQLEAYNKRDIEAFCKHYHPLVEVYRLGEVTEKICIGIDAFKEIYRSRFDLNPELHCKLMNRTVLNQSVLDEEWVSGVAGASAPAHVMAIYAFKDGLIGYVWFTR
jgi:hypothetical protein